ncbi:MAG: hypothetical protein AAB798_02720 [Patescibacteria group bacterium]
MADDDAQSAPILAEPALAPEVAPPIPVEPAPPAPEPTSVVEQTVPAEPASVIPEASQSASNAEVESQPVSQPTSTSQTSEPGHKWSVEDRAKSIATHARKRDMRLAKIVEHAKAHGGKITNDEIEKLLHISDATASRYAKILVARGVLRQEGKGRGAKYTLPT